MDGEWGIGTWGSATWDYVTPIIVVDTHDGERVKKRWAKEKADKKRRREEIVYAFERIVEGRPEIAQEIAAPFLEKRASNLPAIDFDKMIRDVNRVERIWNLHLELDDEEVMLLL
ncbi:MAG: hypothetical protein EXR85_02340 [Xanthomonadales bacterium]|nr:hypothetical protein [Xanthomonadales bacterium]